MEKRIRKRSIKTQLIITMVLLAAIPVIVCLIVSALSSTKTANANVDTLNSLQVKLVEHDFTSVIEENITVLKSLADNPLVSEYIANPSDRLHDQMLDTLLEIDKDFADGNSCILVDANGQQLIRTVGDCINVADREYFQKAKSGITYCSDINISKSTGQRIATFITPVTDIQGNFIGAVQRNYDLADFHDLMVSEVMEENQDVLIVDNTGSVIAHSGHEISVDSPEDQSSNPFYTMSRTQTSKGFCVIVTDFL